MIDIHVLREWGGFMHTRSPTKLDGFAYERDHKTSSASIACRRSNKSVSPLYEKPIYRLRPSQINRLWKDHPHVHTDTTRHWQSIELKLSEYNEKELKDPVKIGVHWIIFFVLLYCKKGQCGKACQGLEAAGRFLCEVVLVNPSCMWRKDISGFKMIQGWYTEGGHTL